MGIYLRNDDNGNPIQGTEKRIPYQNRISFTIQANQMYSSIVNLVENADPMGITKDKLYFITNIRITDFNGNEVESSHAMLQGLFLDGQYQQIPQSNSIDFVNRTGSAMYVDNQIKVDVLNRKASDTSCGVEISGYYLVVNQTQTTPAEGGGGAPKP